MHEIQKEILKKLSFQKKLKYSEIKPVAIEGNMFSYHLRQLLKRGFVRKIGEEGYSLDAKGVHYVEGLSTSDFKERAQPKIFNLILIKKNGKYLLYKNKTAPFIEMIGVPYGKIHLDEHLYDAANRELTEKTGLSATLSYVGHAYVTVHNETELISQKLFHVFTAKKITGDVVDETSLGELFWAKREDVLPQDFIPGIDRIIDLAEKSTEHFFAEYFLNIGDIVLDEE